MNIICNGTRQSGITYEYFKHRLEEETKQYKQENERLHSIIKEVREYIENNSLYYQEEEYDYEENLVLGEPDDTDAKNDILEILDKENKE